MKQDINPSASKLSLDYVTVRHAHSKNKGNLILLILMLRATKILHILLCAFVDWTFINKGRYLIIKNSIGKFAH